MLSPSTRVLLIKKALRNVLQAMGPNPNGKSKRLRIIEARLDPQNTAKVRVDSICQTAPRWSPAHGAYCSDLSFVFISDEPELLSFESPPTPQQ